MAHDEDFSLTDVVLAPWQLNARITRYFFGQLTEDHLSTPVPELPRKTIRMLAGHVHNSRCMWIKMTGRRHGVHPPESVDRFRVPLDKLLPALEESGVAIGDLLKLGLEKGGRLGGFPLPVWQLGAYLAAHEAHHRGQVIIALRQAGNRLPESVTTGVWQWSTRAREIG